MSFSIKVLTCVVAAVALSFMISCADGGKREHNASAASLYGKTVETLKAYTDSVRRAPDSAAVLALRDRCRDRLDHLNFEFPADTDLDMTEGENDTIAILSSRFLATASQRLQSFATQPTDTIPPVPSPR